MVNRSKFQLDIVRAMLSKNSRLRRFRVNENDYAISIDGYYCVVLSKRDAVFDMDKIEEVLVNDSLFAMQESDERVKVTNKLRDTRYGFIKALESDKQLCVWIRNDLLAKFKGCNFYAKSPTGRVLVMDELGGRLVGIVAPVCVTENN